MFDSHLNLDCSTEVAASLFLALHVLEAWLTILMFPSVTCLNKLLSLVQSCLQRQRQSHSVQCNVGVSPEEH